MDEKAKLIKQLQEDDEKQRLIAELEAHDGKGQNLAPDGLPKGLFAPEKRVVVPNQSAGMQAAAGLMGLSNTVGASKLIQTLAPKEFGDRLADQTKAAKEEYAPAYDLGVNTGRSLPALAVPMAGASLGAPGLVVSGGQALAGQALAQGVGGAVKELTDVTSEGSDSLKRAVLTGGADAFTTYLGGKVLNEALPAAGKAITQSKPAQAFSKKVVDGLQSGLKRLGFDASEIRMASNAINKGEVSDSNPLVQLKLLYEKGVLKGAKSTVDAANAVDDVIVNNSLKVDKILQAQGNQVVKGTKVPLNSLEWDADLMVASPLKLQEAIKDTVNKLGLNIIDESGNVRLLTLQEAQSAKKVLDGYSNFDKSDSLAQIKQHVVKTLGSHLRGAIEEASPAIGKLNKLSHAALNMQQKLMSLENKGLDVGKSPASQILSNVVSSPLLSMGAGAGIGGMAAPYLGVDRSTGVALGLAAGAGVKYKNAPKSLQSSLSVLNNEGSMVSSAIPRTLEGLKAFLANPNVQRMLPPALIPVIRQFEFLPPQEAYQLAATVAIPELEKAGVAFEQSSSGYPSELNGRLHSNEDRVAYGAELDKKKNELGLIEWAKQKRAVNADGTINVPPPPPSPPPSQAWAETSQSPSPPEETLEQMLARFKK